MDSSMRTMFFAIRDDDTSFFTSPTEILKAYDFIDENDVISLSIVPFTVPCHKDCVFPYGKDIEYKEYDISKNNDLISWLNEQIKNKRIDVALHGYSHEYKKKNSRWEAESIWKSSSQLFDDLLKGKETLEKLLNTNISVYVAPNNMISKKGIGVVESLGLNYSGIIQHFDRKISFRYLVNYFKRWSYRIIYGVAYGGVLNYGKHLELQAYGVGSFDRLVKEYEMCKQKNQPFVIYTHYWSLLENEANKEALIRIYRYIKDDGAKMIGISSCFEKGKNRNV